MGVFDVVTFNKVLEHVEDPVALLALARPVLASEGFVYYEVPDGESASAEGAGREEFFIEHHHAFSPASAALLSERAGFQPISLARVIEPSGKHTIRIFAQPT
jgi:2-polyprenyl-3-methyl-5-hydroxy-6-metoxy-1,4-benzoquinol methylase